MWEDRKCCQSFINHHLSSRLMILLPMRNVWEVNLSALLKKYVLMNKGKFLHMGMGVGGWGTQLGSSGSFTAKRLRHSHLQEKGGSNLSRYLLIGLELIENLTQILRRSLSLKTACLRWHFSTFLVKASKKCHRNFCTFSASLQLVGPAKVKFNLKMKKESRIRVLYYEGCFPRNHNRIL